MQPRTHTPDHTTTEAGQTVTTIRLKRACNGCGSLLGDVDDRDIDQHGQLTDVRAECGHCAPLVELEAAGCKTWHLYRRDLYEIDGELDDLGVFTKGYFETVDGELKLTGLRIGEKPGHVVARFGDWIIRHPDGQWTVHHAPTNQHA